MGGTFAQATAQTHQTASPVVEVAPPPKQGTPALISEEQALSGDPVALDDAERGDLQKIINEYIDAVFFDLDAALKSALEVLKEPKTLPSRAWAEQLIAGLVGFLTEAAMSYFSAGLFHAAKATVGERAFEGLTEATKNLAIKAGAKAESHIEKFLEVETEREKKEPTDPNAEIVMADPSASTALQEFSAAQKQALTWRKAEVKADTIVGPLSRITKHQAVALAKQLRDPSARLKRVSEFTKQVVFGWMNFETAASLGEKPLVQGKPASNVFHALKLDPADAPLKGAEGAIDVMVSVPDVISGMQSVHIKRISAETSAGAVRTLKNLQVPLATAPVLKRIWLQAGEGVFQQRCVIVIYPNGGMSVEWNDPYLAAIGRMVPREAKGLDHEPGNPSSAGAGAQMLLGLVQTASLKDLQ